MDSISTSYASLTIFSLTPQMGTVDQMKRLTFSSSTPLARSASAGTWGLTLHIKFPPRPSSALSVRRRRAALPSLDTRCAEVRALSSLLFSSLELSEHKSMSLKYEPASEPLQRESSLLTTYWSDSTLSS